MSDKLRGGTTIGGQLACHTGNLADLLTSGFIDDFSGTSATSTKILVTATATSGNNRMVFGPTSSTTDYRQLYTDSVASFYYNPSTNMLTVPSITSTLTGNASTATTATYLSATAQNALITGDTLGLAMIASDSTGKGSFVCRSTGTGDSNLAGITFLNDSFGTKAGVRNDGFWGVGGWSHAAWRFYVDSAGNLTAAGDVSSLSDPRLKENFKIIENPLDIVGKLDGGTFNWKHGFEHTQTKAGLLDYGILADQVEAVMPELINESIPLDGEAYKSVAYSKLIPVLIESIKELTARVKELEKL
jgi:hypothetical protein